MGFDQQGKTVFTVTRNGEGKWDVCEQGFTKALASFDKEQDARDYANNLAKIKQDGSVAGGQGGQAAQGQSGGGQSQGGQSQGQGGQSQSQSGQSQMQGGTQGGQGGQGGQSGGGQSGQSGNQGGVGGSSPNRS